MQPTPPLSTADIFTEAVGLGCSIGLLQAIAETTLIGWNGMPPDGMDLAILAVIYCGAGTALGGLAALTALSPPLRRVLGTARDPLALRRAVWAVVVGGFVLLFLRIVYYWSSWGALLWLAAAAPGLLIAWLAVARRGQRAWVALGAGALATVTLCALQLAHAAWDDQPNHGIFVIRLLLPVAACLAALLVVWKSAAPRRPFEPITRGAVALGLVAAVWAGCWASVAAGLSLDRFARQSPGAANPTRPNVLLIVLDTVRADHLDLFGYQRQTMPNLRRFAEQCQSANRMLTTGSWTLPSHASMFTGLYPSAHGAHHLFVRDKCPSNVAYDLREDVPTLAEFLGGRGYQTAGIVANYGTLSSFGLPRGFQQYDATPGAGYLARSVLWLYRARLGDWSPGMALRARLPAAVQIRSRFFSVKQPPYRRARAITDAARHWLGRHDSHPFFLFLNYLDAHYPYLPPAEDDQRFAKRPAGDEWFGFPTKRFQASERGAEKFTAGEIEFLKAQYDAELVGLDRELGRLFAFLKESGLYDNTLIFVTTDHGEAFFEHGFPDHGSSLYQDQIGGFLLIKAPPSLGPIEVSPLMQFVDFFPTVAAVLHEPAPGGLQGSPWGKGRDYALSEMFCKACGRAWLESTVWPQELHRELVAVMSGGKKLIRSNDGPDEVYDLSSDPTESKPIADPDPEFLRRAGEIIAARNQRMFEGSSHRPADNKALERLRSLGYIQ